MKLLTDGWYDNGHKSMKSCDHLGEINKFQYHHTPTTFCPHPMQGTPTSDTSQSLSQVVAATSLDYLDWKVSRNHKTFYVTGSERGIHWGQPQSPANNWSYPLNTTATADVTFVTYDMESTASYFQWYNSVCGEPETTKQRVAREERELQRRVRAEAAGTKAEQLLFMVISPEQKVQYLEHGYFDTVVSDRVYRIKKGRSGNVSLIESGVAKFRYCIHPSSMVPDQDTMVGQYLMLTTDEQRFLNTANRTVL